MTTPRSKISDLKSFERFLRARGFSKAEARLIASHGARAWLYSKNGQQGIFGGDGKFGT